MALAQIDKKLNINFHCPFFWLGDNDKELHTISDSDEFDFWCCQ